MAELKAHAKYWLTWSFAVCAGLRENPEALSPRYVCRQGTLKRQLADNTDTKPPRF